MEKNSESLKSMNHTLVQDESEGNEEDELLEKILYLDFSRETEMYM